MILFEKQKEIGQIFLKNGIINENQLNIALETQEKQVENLGKILQDLGYVTKDDLVKALAEQFGLPFYDFRDYPKTPPILANLSANYLKQHACFPLEKLDDTITFVVPDPYKVDFLDDVERFLGVACKVALSPEDDIMEAIEHFYGAGATTVEKIISSMSQEDMSLLADEELEDIDKIRDMASEAPVIQLVNLFISKAVEKGASDIHIEPQEKELKVRCRIDGVLRDMDSPPKRLQPAIISRVKIMGELNIAERRLPQDGSTRIKVSGREFDIRISTVPTQYGESVAMRLLDRSGRFISLENLGFPEDNRELFSQQIEKPHGIILVTGPTGSGKTTTLYAALARINSTEKKIITIEDPIEYQLKGINQIQVKPDIGLTFARGLRSLVRQDPDILMIGEIRDLETAEIAIQSALTGHLVFSTVHTNDASSTVTRLVDMGVEHYLIASCLISVVSQRLIRLTCVHCKTAKTINASYFKELGEFDRLNIKSSQVTVYEGAGCEMCMGTGYAGRTGIFELLPINNRMKALIQQKVSASEIRQVAVEMGMKTMRNDGLEKALLGQTTIEEVIMKTQEEGD